MSVSWFYNLVLTLCIYVLAFGGLGFNHNCLPVNDIGRRSDITTDNIWNFQSNTFSADEREHNSPHWNTFMSVYKDWIFGNGFKCLYVHTCMSVCVCVCWACMNVWASALKITGQDTGKTVMLGYSRHHTRWESGSRQVSLQPQLHLLFTQKWTGLQFPRASEALRGSKSAFNNHTSG